MVLLAIVVCQLEGPCTVHTVEGLDQSPDLVPTFGLSSLSVPIKVLTNP